MQEGEVECEAQEALKTVVQMIREMECQVKYTGTGTGGFLLVILCF